MNLKISRFVTEYRAQVLEERSGKRFTAPFPEGVSQPVQYGTGIKAHAVYLSQFQMIPYERVREQFEDQNRIPLSAGSVFNFNKDAYDRLEPFELWVKQQLKRQEVLHADETGINIAGKNHWLHCASSPLLTYFSPHPKRGKEAMDEMGVLPEFNGIVCHDHWKPYYRYDCVHALCNAHIIRKLERAWEQDGQQWAKDMQTLLLELNQAVDSAGGLLAPNEAQIWIRKYHQLLDEAETECPPPDKNSHKGKRGRGRPKRSKARNLLERLRDFASDVLRFVEVQNVPFTNNQAENDLRMTKVHQKISGCFRSMEGAKIFCRIRSYLSTCRKQGLSATYALNLLFQGQLPDFMTAGAE